MSFTADLTKYAKKTKSDIGTAKRAIVFNVFREVIKRTPVDTGRAKSNWFVSEGVPSTQINQRTDKSNLGNIGKHSAQELKSITINLGFDFLTNNLPYIGSLEYGRSDQAPLGMVRTTLRQFVKIANKQGWK